LKDRVLAEVRKVVVGRDREASLLLTCLLARGHVLLEGVPGVSKTLLAKSFARCLNLEFGRVQFTPDMLPMDILGGFVFNLKTREFDFKRGPIFTGVILADEINRAPPKVQSALLEAMQEEQVTVEGHTEKLPSPFMVIATQNPIEFQGVYPLPEGQLDRFTARVRLEYQSWEVERDIIRRNLSELSADLVEPVVSPSELAEALIAVEKVSVSDELVSYLAEFGRASREDPRVILGASPRAMVHLVHAARASAYLDGRSFVIPDDIKSLAVPVLAHRLSVEQVATSRGGEAKSELIVKEVLDTVKTPR
jgi:MoxR-like ATPase